MYARPIRRSEPPETAPASSQRRWTDVSGNAGAAMNPARDAADKSAQGGILEAEIKGLRQLLAEVQANRDSLRRQIDDLRRDRDHWQALAKSAEREKAAPRTWFCGSVSPSNSR